ncbi:acyl-CoA/acyl-ACP dehydrogenase, partial [bacterium]|nr:acyl-CoA/acyl-ACP dehydrogenase [bacterium]
MTNDRLEWIRDYASTRINSRMYDERRCFPPHIILDFGNQGLLGMQVPSRYGGLDIGCRDALRVIEQLGSIDLSLGLLVGLNNILGIRPIQNFASDSIKEEWLPKLAQGRELGAFSITEPGAGSNPRSIQSTAKPNAHGGWDLYGKKIWSGSASWAGVLNVFVKHHGEDGATSGMSGFVVKQGSPGLYQGPEALTMGMRGMVQNEFVLDGVHVDSEQLLGEVGDGFAVATDAMSYGRVAIGSLALGGMKRCIQLMQRYAKRRTVSTGRLFDNPYSRLCLSNNIMATCSLESLIQQVGAMMDRGVSIPQEINTICKINGPELLWNAVDDLTQMLGGRGFIESNLVPQMLRDSRI